MERRSGDSDGVSFLTALLVRFPEVGSATLTQNGQLLSLDFYLTRRLKKSELSQFEEHLRLSWEVFFALQRVQARHFLVRRTDTRRGSFEHSGEEGSQEVDSIQIVRDLDSVTVEELSLLVALVSDRFGRDLAINEEIQDEEEDDYQDDLVHRSLEMVRGQSQEVDLTGFRDDMRVLIYASEGGD